MLTLIGGKLESIRMSRDERLHKTIFHNSERIYMYYLAAKEMVSPESGGDMMIPPEMKKGYLSAQLEFVKAFPGIKSSFEIIKSEYPEYGAALGGFLEELIACTSRAFLINKYEKLKSIDRQYDSFGDLVGNLFFDSYMEQEPYHRSSPKIGRNDPCPCGSGKKYKNCCGKN